MKTNTKRSKNQKAAASAKTKVRRQRKWLQGVTVGLVLALGSAAGLAAYKQHYETIHDLSVIGNGTPTVVQIHDPSCPKCRQLRSNVGAASRSYKDNIQFRIADITTAKGRRIADEHNVQHVTLLLFDGEGRRRQILRGISPIDALKRAFHKLSPS